MRIAYEFRCPTCRRDHTLLLDPHEDELVHRDCDVCGHPMQRVFGATIGHIDWVNGGFHGDDVNLGLGKHFKSARERDSYAAEQGLVKA